MMKFLWVGIVISLVCSKWVDGFVENSVHETELSLLEANGSKPVNNFLMVKLTLIQGAAAKGAVCLDGSLPGYHWHRRHGSGKNNWLIFLEGGGWCNNITDCVNRSNMRLGSSKYMEKEIPFSGILSPNATESPDFYNWNRVKIRACDGGSFAGDSENKEAQLHFRGQRIYLAAMEKLMSKGMCHAKQALLAGCSAGGLACILHCDQFRDLFPTTTKVKCFSDAGFFLDAVDIAGRHTLRKYFSRVVHLQGLQKNLPRSCTKHLDPTSCFFPQNLINKIKTPLFLLNQAYDSYQVQYSLATPSADPHGYWIDCKLNLTNCSPSQMKFLQGFREQMLHALKKFSKSNESGLFINSCYTHCEAEWQGAWLANNSTVIGNKTIAIAVGDWYTERAVVKAIDYGCHYNVQ